MLKLSFFRNFFIFCCLVTSPLSHAGDICGDYEYSPVGHYGFNGVESGGCFCGSSNPPRHCSCDLGAQCNLGANSIVTGNNADCNCGCRSGYVRSGSSCVAATPTPTPVPTCNLGQQCSLGADSEYVTGCGCQCLPGYHDVGGHCDADTTPTPTVTITPTPTVTVTATPTITVTPTPTPGPTPNLASFNCNFRNVIQGTSTANTSRSCTAATVTGFTSTGCTATIIPSQGAANEFVVSRTRCSIFPTRSCTFTIDGTPLTAAPPTSDPTGQKTANLSVNCGGSITTTTTSPLYEVSASWPSLTLVSPLTNAYTFTPNVTAGSSTSPVSVIVTNTGSLAATNCTVAPAAGGGYTDNAKFTASIGTCNTIQPSSTCVFTVTGITQSSDSARVYNTQVQLSCSQTTDVTDNQYILNSSGSPSPVSIGPGPGPYSMSVVAGCPYPGQYNLGSGCLCPPSYELTATTTEALACRPILPSPEFYKNVSSDGYPVCGPNRVPVDALYNVYDIATSSWPETSDTYIYGSAAPYTYKFTVGNGLLASGTPIPTYVYSNLSRCVCANAAYPYSIPAPAAAPNQVSTVNFARDDLNTILSASSSNPPGAPGSLSYSTVPIASDNVSNGYLGNVFAAGQATCSCPNLNEKATAFGGSPGGMSCTPTLNLSDATTKSYAVLTAYNSGLSSQLMTTTPAQLLNQTNVMLPVNTISNPNGMTTTYQNYHRRIWTCAPPTTLDLSSGKCIWQRSLNECEGTSSNPSVVSSKITGSLSPSLAFQHAVNKKLACCLNTFNSNLPNNALKFDCVDNSTKNYSTFDELWSDHDSQSDGGQAMAVALSNSAGQLVTGFYTLKGERCSEFSEFAGQISTARVNQSVVSGQQVLANGSKSTTTIDTSGSVTLPALALDSGWTNWLSTNNKKTPTMTNSAADMRRCPILVRAAVVSTCLPYAQNPPLPAAQQSYFDNSDSTLHCTAAQQVKIHLRVEQIYEIAGLPKMATVDSVLDSSQAATVNVSDLIQSKTSGVCPAGMTWSSGSCSFQ